jgi:sec-independent protein translocase protein TatA
MDIGASELIIVLVVVLLIFGGSKVPELARSLGKAQSEFKKGLGGDAGESKVRAAAVAQAATPEVAGVEVTEVVETRAHESVA